MPNRSKRSTSLRLLAAGLSFIAVMGLTACKDGSGSAGASASAAASHPGTDLIKPQLDALEKTKQSATQSGAEGAQRAAQTEQAENGGK